MDREKCFKTILDCSFKMHTALGPGLLESAYEECLLFELRQKGLLVEKQKALPLVYEGVTLDSCLTAVPINPVEYNVRFREAFIPQFRRVWR